MKYIPKKIPEGINVTSRHPLLNFAYLLGTVVAVSIFIFVVLGFVAEWLVIRVSPETETQIGDMLVQPALDKKITDDKRIQYIEELLNSLLIPGETTRLPLQVHLINNDVINAAITVGGHVLVHTALLETVKSENELALVLGHELGHFQAHDPLKSLGRSLVFLTVSSILGVGMSQSGGLPKIIPLTSELTNLNYSRIQERAADIYGFNRVVKHYGHGGHSLDFFERLAKGESKLQKVSQYFLTHPLSQDRINDLNAEAAKQGWKMEEEVTPLPQWLHCSNMKPCEQAE